MFSKKKLKKIGSENSFDAGVDSVTNAGQTSPVPQPRQNNNQPHQPPQPASRPKLTFHCQQAQGSPTGIISGFSNVKELYSKIAECYDIAPSDILFCTLNTHKIDMKMLLGGQIGLDDFIFAHVKGQPKEVEVTKSDDALGLTITDNGAGYAFIKRIKEGSVMSQYNYIKVGDHIERINDHSLVGCRHYEVARLLKEIPKGTTFTIRLIEPLSSGFSNIGMKQTRGTSGNKSYGSGKQTLRFRANEQAQIEDVSTTKAIAQEKINNLLESFMGINDSDLASRIFELGESKTNTMEFAESIDSSELVDFGFTDTFIFELWGAITDAKSGR